MNKKFKENSFDYIVSHTTLHHLTPKDQILVLKKIKEILRPGGKLVLIDIVSKGLMKNHPDIARRIGAFITLVLNLLKFKPSSVKNYKKSIHPLWMEHLKMDKFLSPKKFIEIYSSVLENAKFTKIKKEYGLLNLIVVEWIKPY